MKIKQCLTFLLTVALLTCVLGSYSANCATVEITFMPDISLGMDFVVALRSDGSAFAWGDNSYGQLGNGTAEASSFPLPVTMPRVGNKTLAFREIAAGYDHALAIAEDGTLWSWGADANGQLGNRTTESNVENSLIPKQITNGISEKTFVKIAAGKSFSMALSSDGAVYVWGTSQNGVLGDGESHAVDGANAVYPQKVEALSSYYITDVSAGTSTAAARDASGNVHLWGQNDNLQAGKSGPAPALSPVLKEHNIGKTVKAVSVGKTHTAFLMQDGTVYSFGSNLYGQMGNGTSSDLPTHLLKELSGEITVQSVAVGDQHSLALSTDGKIYAWGDNQYLQISADAGSSAFSTPTEMTSAAWEKPVSVAACGNRSAVLDSLGNVYIWGNSETEEQLTPVLDGNGVDFSLGTPPKSYTQSSDITLQATIPTPVFTVTIPASLNVGELTQKEYGDADALSVTPFEIRVSNVDNLFGEKQITVSVSAEGGAFVLRDGAYSLSYAIYNAESGGGSIVSGSDFASFTADGLQKGRLEIDQSNITRKGSYSGTVTFTVRTEACTEEG